MLGPADLADGYSSSPAGASPGQITPDIITKHYPEYGSADPFQHWFDMSPEEQKGAALSHIEAVSTPGSGMYSPDNAEKWTKIYQEAFGEDPSQAAPGTAPGTSPAAPATSPFDPEVAWAGMLKADPQSWGSPAQATYFKNLPEEGWKNKLAELITQGEKNLAAGYDTFTPDEVKIYKDLYKTYFGALPPGPLTSEQFKSLPSAGTLWWDHFYDDNLANISFDAQKQIVQNEIDELLDHQHDGTLTDYGQKNLTALQQLMDTHFGGSQTPTPAEPAPAAFDPTAFGAEYKKIYPTSPVKWNNATAEHAQNWLEGKIEALTKSGSPKLDEVQALYDKYFGSSQSATPAPAALTEEQFDDFAPATNMGESFYAESLAGKDFADQKQAVQAKLDYLIDLQNKNNLSMVG